MKQFPDKYDNIIFDMDGVITSEENYWNAAALTVWEYLNWNMGRDIDCTECIQNTSAIRSRVFCDDELIVVLKNKGVNSNWDLGYVTVLIAWAVGGKDKMCGFDRVLEYAKELPDNILEAYDNLAGQAAEKTGFDYDWLERNGLMWQTMQRLFQGWYLGDDAAAQFNKGKTGFCHDEQPIIAMDDLHAMLSQLHGCGCRLSIATGRLASELIGPLKKWDVLKYFSQDGICTYDYVVEAEKETSMTLTKPHPYMFLKALYGTGFSDKNIVNENYDKKKIERTLVVGDAGADMFAAKAMGADFCAVLTGVNKQAARGFFEENNAQYILNSSAELI